MAFAIVVFHLHRTNYNVFSQEVVDVENLSPAVEDEGCDAEVLSSVAAEATLTDKQVH